MKENCLDIGTIQAFLDGELASDSLENAARHISVCGDCALQLAAAEEETAFAFSALEQELNPLVPTQRLWTKINDSIKKERKSFWQTAAEFFKNPTVATFAGLLIVFGLFVSYLSLRSDMNNNFIAENKQNATKTKTLNPTSAVTVKQNDEAVAQIPEIAAKNENTGEKINLPAGSNDFRVVKTEFKKDENKRLLIKKDSKANLGAPSTAPNSFAYQYMPGEESYIKTISALEKTIESEKEEVLKPSAQVSFARNLAVLDDAINKMKTEVRKNPKNEVAKQLLLSSYQNKVDLLNSVAEKTELMATIK